MYVWKQTSHRSARWPAWSEWSIDRTEPTEPDPPVVQVIVGSSAVVICVQGITRTLPPGTDPGEAREIALDILEVQIYDMKSCLRAVRAS